MIYKRGDKSAQSFVVVVVVVLASAKAPDKNVKKKKIFKMNYINVFVKSNIV